MQIDSNMSMYSYLKEGCKDSKQLKMIYFSRKFNAREMFLEIEKYKNLLISHGVRAGDTVAIALPNTPSAIFALYATNAIGATVNLIHPKLSKAKFLSALKVCNSRVVFIYDNLFVCTHEELRSEGIAPIVCRVSDYAKGFKRLLIKLFVDAKKALIQNSEFRIQNCGNIINNSTPMPYALCPMPSDGIAVYLHSGGTTGEPKTIALTNRALNELSGMIIDTVYQGTSGYKSTDSMLMSLPIFHGFGLGVAVHTLLPRQHIIITPMFRAEESAKLIKKYKISHLALVPVMVKRLLKAKSFKGDFSFLTHIFCGGDKLSNELKNAFNNRLKELNSPAVIMEGYGLSEASAVFSLNLNPKEKPDSQGKPLLKNEAGILTEDGNILPFGEGEICLSGSTLMKGYLGEETNDALFESGGKRWLRTGDIGKIDNSGHIYYKDRIKRSIKITAENVFPAEVEKVIGVLKEIEDLVAVRALDNGSPCINLFVVTANGVVLSEEIKEKICLLVSENIGKYAVPRNIFQVQKLHRTPFGKTDYLKYEKENYVL
ncbi:MAG: acyl--CoA ligase [Firmicutes bacterium]|nr:acyl--CoA ligase [Bacillota bacterium]